jgi:PAS domain S-box-containing protein
MLLVVLIAATFALTSFLLVGNRMHNYLDSGQIDWANTLMTSVSEGLARDTIDGNAVHARESLQQIVAQDTAIEYIYVTDFEGNLFAHSFEGGFPRVLLEHLEEYGQIKEHNKSEWMFDTSQGRIHDYNQPVIKGLPAHIHIGINESRVDNLIARLYRELFWWSILITIICLLVIVFYSRRITVPLSVLTTQVNKYAKGEKELGTQRPQGDKEVLKLFDSFTDMLQKREQAEEALKESEHNLQSILDNTPAIVYVKDLHGRFLLINRQFEKLFNISNEEVQGKTTSEISPKDIASEHMANDMEVLRLRQPIEYEEVAPLQDGEHTYHSVKFCLYDNEDQPYAVCGISTDITKQKVSDEQLRRSQKMEAMGKLTGGIAHDFNNMLNIITGYAEILNRSLEDNPHLKNFAMEIRRAGERGTDMTSKLLSFSRERSAKEEKININEFLHEESSLLKKTLTARIPLTLNLQEDLWPVWVDKGDFEDAILNICINAMHAMPDGGEVTISTLNVIVSNTESLVMELPAGEYVRLSIRDSGIGMDKQTLAKVFDPFFTTKGEQGTGLGMSQVYGFVQRSSGDINVVSEPGKGTTISMYFPHFTGQQQDAADEKDVIDSDLRGSESILIVDDEPSLCRLAREILVQRGYEVYTSERAEDALQILKTHKVDLLLSDVIMPGMDGYQLASKVRELYPHIKIQLVSGYTADKFDDEKHEDLRNNLLSKPYSVIALLQQVRNQLDDKSLH